MLMMLYNYLHLLFTDKIIAKIYRILIINRQCKYSSLVRKNQNKEALEKQLSIIKNNNR